MMEIIDCHNHSLPNIDDGAKNMAMAIAMLRQAEHDGISEVILTPHHLNGAFENFSHNIVKETDRLKLVAIENNINISLHVGSEIHLTPETVQQVVENRALSYCNQGKAVLVELPKHNIPVGVERILSELIFNGVTPIVAHPERNSELRKDFGALREWVEFGCKTQVTGQSYTGRFGEEIRSTTMKMLSDGLVHLVASDAHRPTGRSPKLQQAATMIKDAFGDQVSELLFYKNPKRLINGEPLLNLRASKKKCANNEKSWLERTIKLVTNFNQN